MQYFLFSVQNSPKEGVGYMLKTFSGSKYGRGREFNALEMSNVADKIPLQLCTQQPYCMRITYIFFLYFLFHRCHRYQSSFFPLFPASQNTFSLNAMSMIKALDPHPEFLQSNIIMHCCVTYVRKGLIVENSGLCVRQRASKAKKNSSKYIILCNKPRFLVESNKILLN